MNSLHKMALQYIGFRITRKNHFYTHICVVSCAFQTQLNYKLHNSPNMQTVILPLSIQMNPYRTKILKHSSQPFMTPYSTSNQNTLSVTSNHKYSTSPTNDSSTYKNKINTPPTNIPSDRSRHFSHNQTDSLPPLIDRTTKTTYKLRQQPKLDYRLFITPSKL